MEDKLHNESRVSWLSVATIVLGIATIIIPLSLWLTGWFMPALMLGMFIGATVRIGTDSVILMIGKDAFSSASGKEKLVYISMVVLQLGTLFGAAILWFYTQSTVAQGIIFGMVISYVFAAIVILITDSNEENDDVDDEWEYDVDDV